ncbi:MAG: CRISPR-associated endonuclease Cas1 [Thaumarchaeota archaeon]|nr:CRISPR-associated endonuclease Cas1 [Nitrososphaerota archaeon]
MGKKYYPTFSKCFNEELRFNTRNSQRRHTANDASDVINELLNYGFGILYGEVTKALNTIGFDCSVGFYHQPHASNLVLVYDMIEPHRH